MTTLFNLFCPFLSSYTMVPSIFWLVLLSGVFSWLLLTGMTSLMNYSSQAGFSLGLFSMSGTFNVFMITGFLVLALLNLSSLICYSYPVTTTLGFNFSLAVSLWVTSVMILLVKVSNASTVLPVNSPWYLVPFLALVEVVSIGVRPITLCFRLLANMSAGHILLTLICKMSYGLWTLGVLFGLLELMVSVVQAFVFLMLTSVYIEESMTH